MNRTPDNDEATNERLVKRLVAQWAYAPADDPWMLFLVTLLLLSVTYWPAICPRRAMALDPMTALRCE